MSHRIFYLCLYMSLALLSACSEEAPVVSNTRPVMVIKPLLSNDTTVAFPGEVRARLEPALAFRLGGKVTERLVDVGTKVTTDQVLARLDPEDVRLHLDAMQAQVSAAQANLQLVQAERDRYKKLLDRQLLSRSHYDTAENQFKAGAARLRQAQAELEAAKNQADYTELRAPYFGVISQAQVEAGQVVAAGQTVFILAADGEREVAINLPEHSIERFKVGQAVEVTLWSQPDRRFAGEIREIAPSADSRSRTYAARVAFRTATIAAELGQSARVYMHSSADNEYAVPLSAVTAEADQPYVWVVDPATSQVHKRNVQLGAFGQEQVPVVDGLQGDEWVVAAGVHLLLEGQAVRPVDRTNQPVPLSAKE
ncbi:efflux RND transporter periplasmic adaptor subunit [Pseudomonas sp. C27(2019)]|uniref:efflux RND transporter periplasmic adaptor subunit n=1 Tax=Pseudomonas sp. C27(2019) TaxID=2604941 RepID=UPI001248F465|nr:efflux RND transporter periplasmic adaptor subunit [Pseudomonas sp. C27(2019)]QEY57978.1 efflux RND transporter periplasmic adaptor subunit [Pseudomonas sp. C27(2019)]